MVTYNVRGSWLVCRGGYLGRETGTLHDVCVSLTLGQGGGSLGISGEKQGPFMLCVCRSHWDQVGEVRVARESEHLGVGYLSRKKVGGCHVQ